VIGRGIALLRLDHVQLAMPAGGEEAARAFYGTVLGLDEVPKPSELAKRGGAWFRQGEIVLHVGVDEAFVPARKAHPAFRCADYDEFLKRLSAHGIAIAPDAVAFGGNRHCYIADPFGNRIELIES